MRVDVDQETREQAAQFLREVQEVIADPDNWCQFSAHRRVMLNTEHYIFGHGEFIDQWCLTGAMNRVATMRCTRITVEGNGRIDPEFIALAHDTLQNIIGKRTDARYYSLPGFNDNSDHEDVMLVLKESIHTLEQGD